MKSGSVTGHVNTAPLNHDAEPTTEETTEPQKGRLSSMSMDVEASEGESILSSETPEVSGKGKKELKGMQPTFISYLNDTEVDENQATLAKDVEQLNSADQKTKEGIKKHSRLWVAFQKIKRFFRSVAINNDPGKITSKDFKEMPKVLLESTQGSLHEKLQEYNVAREELIQLEKQGTAKDATFKQQELLELSKDIFTTAKSLADAEGDDMVELLFNDISDQSELNQLIQKMKSRIGFSPKRVNVEEAKASSTESKYELPDVWYKKDERGATTLQTGNTVVKENPPVAPKPKSKL